MDKSPVKIEKIGHEGIRITWNDGEVSEIGSLTLRKNCPSAGNNFQPSQQELTGRAKLNVVKPGFGKELQLLRVWGIGNYAIGIEWGDGHKTGIYSYKLLNKLAKED